MKIVKSDKKRLYEVTYLTAASLTETELKAVQEQVTKLVAKYKGETKEVQNWGKKALAYSIKIHGKTHTEAVYTHQIVIFDLTQAPEFEKELYLNEQLVRHLVVVAEDQKDVA
jgi:small subunit ribosomal protein S6